MHDTGRVNFRGRSLHAATIPRTDARIGKQPGSGWVSRSPRMIKQTLSPTPAHSPAWSSDLFGPEQLERHAIALAAAHESITAGASNRLLARLHENEQILR